MTEDERDALREALAAEREACVKVASDQVAIWREAERDWQTPKNDLTAHLIRTAAKNRAEVAETIEAAIRARAAEAKRDVWAEAVEHVTGSLVAVAFVGDVAVMSRAGLERLRAQSEAAEDDDWRNVRIGGGGAAVYDPECRPCEELVLSPLSSKAAQDVLAERRRQVEAEGWTPEHDDRHTVGDLASAAICYATMAVQPEVNRRAIMNATSRSHDGVPFLVRHWPWPDCRGWKPTNPRRDLVKAGALILAEIERLDRAHQPRMTA